MAKQGSSMLQNSTGIQKIQDSIIRLPCSFVVPFFRVNADRLNLSKRRRNPQHNASLPSFTYTQKYIQYYHPIIFSSSAMELSVTHSVVH